MAVSCGMVVASCSLVGDDSSACGTGEGLEILGAAGMGTEGLTVDEGCTYAVEGLRSGEVRSVVATGNEQAVEAALEQGGLDRSRASSSRWDAVDLPPFDVTATPSGQEWSDGDLLVFRDEIDHRGRPWDRYVAWGRKRAGTDYMVAIVLETGSL